MHVPYSMDDSEPDLYGSLGGRYSDGPDDYQDLASSYGDPSENRPSKPPMFLFHTVEDLVRSDIFHELLLKSLVHKDREIARLRNEILDMM